MTTPVHAPHSAPSVVDSYHKGDFLFCSPSRGLLAEGEAHRVSPGTAGWAAAAAEALRHAPGSIVVGALGYDPAATGRLVVPAAVRHTGPLSSTDEAPTAPVFAPHRRWGVRPCPNPAAYEHGVRRALELMASGGLEKVVLARSLELTAPAPVPVESLVARLAGRDPRAHVFALDITEPEDPLPRTLIGASPELLVSRHGTQVLAHPLAGSMPRHPDPVTDRAHASALARSEKDLREHRAVVELVVQTLHGHCVELHVPAEPFLVRTATMWHLSTRISGKLVDPSTTSLALAEALHPTPAVAGTPTAAAQTTIGEIEETDRDYYAGLVGWCDAAGDGEWVVTIRCAEVAGPRMRLFAGAGVVPGSVPAHELAETSAKFRTLLSAVGVEAQL